MRYCLPAAFLLTIAAIVTPARAQPPAPPEFARISGTIVDQRDDHPLRRAQVCLQPDTGYLDLTTGYCDETDEKGRFTIREVLPGRYSLRVMREGYFAQDPVAVGLPSVIALNAGDDMSGIVARLSQSASISGRVVFDDGEPFPGAEIQLFRVTGGSGSDREKLGDNGEFRLSDVSPGDYSVRVVFPNRRSCEVSKNRKSRLYIDRNTGREALPVHVESGTQAIAPDIVMVETEAHRVSGRIAWDNYPLPGSWILQTAGSTTPVRSADGTFVFCDMAPGDYTIRASSRIDGRSVAGDVKISIGNEDLKSVEIPTELSASIRARIVVEDNIPLDLSRTQILTIPELHPHDSVPQPRRQPDGTFVIDELYAADYRFFVSPLPQGSYLKSAFLNGQDVVDTPFMIQSGEDLAGLVFTISAKAGGITGVVQDETGSAVPDAFVILQPDPAHRYPDIHLCMKTTDQGGEFACDNLAPGKYRVLAWRKFPDFEVGRNEVASRGTQVEAQESGRVSVVLTVPKQ